MQLNGYSSKTSIILSVNDANSIKAEEKNIPENLIKKVIEI